LASSRAWHRQPVWFRRSHRHSQAVQCKIDHNITNNHKANVNWSYERVVSDDVFHAFPDTFSNENFRRPIVVTAGLVSTLSPSLLNEFRFGYRLQDLNVIAPMALPQYQDALADCSLTRRMESEWFPSTASRIPLQPPMNPCPPHYGSRPPTNAPAAGTAAGCNVAPTSKGKTPTWTFSDTFSWTHGTHAFRFNGELRLNSSSTITPGTTDFVGTSTYASATLGSFGSTAPSAFATTGLNNNNPSLSGLQSGGSGANARTLMNVMAGSLSGLAMQYYIDNPNLSSPAQITDWRDFRNNEYITVKVKQTEFSAWAKDEWKVTPQSHTHSWPAVGLHRCSLSRQRNDSRTDGGRRSSFRYFRPGFYRLDESRVRSNMSTFEFVGPNSPNPNKSAYPNIYHNFGPSFAFSWSLPWFGEGKTTIRGGYQITYSTGSPNPGSGRFSSYSQALSGAPGRTLLVNANSVAGKLPGSFRPQVLTRHFHSRRVWRLSAAINQGPRNQSLQYSIQAMTTRMFKT
jgi:hypothetical protein